MDDFIFVGNNSVIFDEFKKSTMIEFKMFDLVSIHYLLDIEVIKFTDGISVCKKKNV